MRSAAIVVLLALAASHAFSADSVFTTLSTRDNPDGATIFSASTGLSNSENIYSIGFSNRRAHGKDGRRFKMTLGNGLQSGFSALVDNVAISVNGIPAKILQLKKETLRKWSGPGGAEGVEFKLNFDGARVDVRFSMVPGSPVLFGEIVKSEDGVQLTPVTNVAVRITAIPSFLECGSGRKTRFYKYARQVRTAARLIELPPNRTEKMLPSDRYFILQDGEYDGSEEGRGRGPSATWAFSPTVGTVTINDSWTTYVEYRPKLDRPFRFALFEFKSKRVSNKDFLGQTARLASRPPKNAYK